MNETKLIAVDRVQAQLVDWLRDGPDEGPARGLERVLSGARAVDQRPRTMFPSTWLPRSVPQLQWRRPSLGLAPTLLILTLLLVLALAVVYVGSRPHLPESLGPSRDRLVAFSSNDDGPISVARVDGTGRREISGGLPGVSPLFSPDGSRVAFVSVNHGPDGGNALYVVSVERSADPVEVSHGVSVLVNDEPQISWSPDGSAIAFTGVAIRETPAAPQSSVGSSIFVAQADGSEVAQITVDDMDRDLPTWATFWDGDRIAFRATELDGSSVLLGYVRPDGSDFVQITSLPTTGGSLSGVDWSPANDVDIEVSYTIGFGFGTPTQAMLDWLPISSTGTMNVAPWIDGVGGLKGYAPAWSPDGRWIAFITAAGDVVLAENKAPAATIYNPGIYDGQLRHLGNVADCWIDWSPDGTALYGGSPDGCTGTIVIPVDDPDSAFVTYTPMSGVTSWQPLEP